MRNEPTTQVRGNETGSDAAKRMVAIKLAQRACSILSELGVDVRIIGSLANGSFTQTSDIDFLILRCPRELKYAIEGRVEDCLEGQSFDVLYADEIPSHKSESVLRQAVDARTLR